MRRGGLCGFGRRMLCWSECRRYEGVEDGWVVLLGTAGVHVGREDWLALMLERKPMACFDRGRVAAVD